LDQALLRSFIFIEREKDMNEKVSWEIKHQLERIVTTLENMVVLMVLGLILTGFAMCAASCGVRVKLHDIRAENVDDGRERVKYSGYQVCQLPILVFAAKGTDIMPAEWIKQATEYWNEEVGIELFAWAGVLSTKYLVPALIEGRGRLSTIVVEYENMAKYDQFADGYYMALSKNGKCVTSAKIMASYLYAYMPSYAEGIVRHELGHALGLAHAKDGGLMYYQVEFFEARYKREVGDVGTEAIKSAFIDSGWFVPEASREEILAVRGLYRGMR
jgi:hypothetical protein